MIVTTVPPGSVVTMPLQFCETADTLVALIGPLRVVTAPVSVDTAPLTVDTGPIMVEFGPVKVAVGPVSISTEALEIMAGPMPLLIVNIFVAG